MSGLDKIVARLASDCDAECKAISDKAEKKAESILADAAEQGKIRAEEILNNAEKQATETVRLATSSAELKERQSLLSKKVQLINNVLEDALKLLNSMDDSEYFEALKNLSAANALKGNGVMLVSSEDAEKMPANYESDINALVKGGSLKIEKSERLNEKGTILVYGDIEVNLTFSALIDANKDEYKSIAREILFK